MKTDLNVGSKIKVVDSSSKYYRYRGTIKDVYWQEDLDFKGDGKPYSEVFSFVCSLKGPDGHKVVAGLFPYMLDTIQKKFIDIEHLREASIDLGNGVIRNGNAAAFCEGDVVQITEKIDGANASVCYNADEGKLEVFSRTNLLDGADGLRGFKAYIETKFKADEFKEFPELVIFGEWCVSHHCKYESSWYNVWRVYDIWNKNLKDYMPQTFVKQFCKEHGIEYIHELYYGPFISWAHCRSFMDKKTYGGIEQEGVVVKNQTKLGRSDVRYPKYLKIVNDAFKESMASKPSHRPVDPEVAKKLAEDKKLMSTIVTAARVRKIILKLVDEGIVPAELEPKHIGIVIKNASKLVYDDCLKEEPEVMAAVGPNAGKLSNMYVAEFVKKLILGK